MVKQTTENNVKVFDFGGEKEDAVLRFFGVDVPIIITDEYMKAVINMEKERENVIERLNKLSEDTKTGKGDWVDILSKEVATIYNIILGEGNFDAIYKEKPDSIYWASKYPAVQGVILNLFETIQDERVKETEATLDSYLNG